jgi:hypothetical protein
LISNSISSTLSNFPNFSRFCCLLLPILFRFQHSRFTVLCYFRNLSSRQTDMHFYTVIGFLSNEVLLELKVIFTIYGQFEFQCPLDKSSVGNLATPISAWVIASDISNVQSKRLWTDSFNTRAHLIGNARKSLSIIPSRNFLGMIKRNLGQI